MAELKRLFVGAKMDKDSDERFVSMVITQMP